MSTVTELALFKDCVERPKHITFVEDLNLDRIPNPSNFEELSNHETNRKKAIKLFHMAWSGTTKYIREICMQKGKPIEFPGLGIFNPLKFVKEVSGDKLTSNNLDALNHETHTDVEFYAYQSFLSSCQNKCKIT